MAAKFDVLNIENAEVTGANHRHVRKRPPVKRLVNEAVTVEPDDWYTLMRKPGTATSARTVF
jgi:hypothetical protein